MDAATASAQDVQQAAVQGGSPATAQQELLCQQQQQQSQACSSKGVQGAALTASPANEDSSSADDSTPCTHESGFDAPVSCLKQSSRQHTDGCWLQAGQEVWLLGKTCKHGSDSSFTEHELLLRVTELRGMGTTGEIYDVQVLQHTCVTQMVSAAASDPAGLAPTAAAAGPLTGRQLCLKVSRPFQQIPQNQQDEVFGNAASYLIAMEASMEQHHSIMSTVGSYGSSSICSHLFGNIRSSNSTKLPALLMDRADISMDQQLQQPSVISPGVRGLSKQLTRTVMSHVLGVLCDLYYRGWAYLDIKPANIVSSTISNKHSHDQRVQYALVDFGSPQYLKAVGGHTRRAVAGTSEYMSPEWYDWNDISCKADIWAMGILLFELRMGRPPRAELVGLRDPDMHLQHWRA